MKRNLIRLFAVAAIGVALTGCSEKAPEPVDIKPTAAIDNNSPAAKSGAAAPNNSDMPPPGGGGGPKKKGPN